MRRLVPVVICACFPLVALSAQIQEYRLTNGLKLIVKEDRRAPVVLSSIWYRVGGADETEGKTGLSHLLEHWMFRGTKQFGPGKFNQIIRSLGGESNAETSADYTVYYELLPAKDLTISFELEADRMNNLMFNAETFQKEKQIVMEERRMRVDDNPRALTQERFRAAAFYGDPYAHPVIGWMDDIKNITMKDAEEWYRRWYAPNNAVIVVVGDVTGAQAFMLAKKYFGGLKASTENLAQSKSVAYSPLEKKIKVHANAKLPWVIVGFLTPTFSTIDIKNKPEIYALSVLSYILGGGESARFSRDIVRKQKIAVSMSVDYNPFNLYNTVFSISGTPAKRASQLIEAIQLEINKLKNKPVTHAELSRAKMQIYAENVYQNDSLMQQAFELGVPEMAGLSWHDATSFSKKTQAVTAAEVQLVAKKYLDKKNETIAELVPKG